MSQTSKWFGLLSRRERWGFTWRGWLTLATLVLSAAVTFLFGIYSFLAVTKPVPATVLVVEGWVDPPALHAAAEEFQKGGYELLLTTGGPTSTDPDSTSVSDTYASVAAKKLLELGVDRARLQMVPCSAAERGRTYASAAALSDYLRKVRPGVTALNVLTEGVHARRTRLTYERAFSDGTAIGIISSADIEFNPGRWWRSSEGLKEVISESAAYLYARLPGD